MSTNRHNKPTRLSIESLEHRRLMAGDVQVAVSGGDLYITGDNNSNSIEVRQIGIDRFEVKGVQTKINGKSGAPVFSGVFDDVHISMNGGDDRVVVKGNLPSELTIAGGSGNDYIKVDQLKATEIEISTGSGKDQVYIQNCQLADDVRINNNLHNTGDFDTISLSNVQLGTKGYGTLKLDMHAGHDKVYLERVATDQLIVDLYNGDDYLSIRNTTVRDKWSLDGGNGVDGLNRIGNNKAFDGPGFNRYTAR